MLKLAIVGSHVLTDQQTHTARLLCDGLIRIYLAKVGLGELVVVSGGADGVDSIAVDVARWVFGAATEEYWPFLNQWEPNGYKERNIRIAESCDILWCIRSRASLTFGSKFTADKARKLGKQAYEVWV